MENNTLVQSEEQRKIAVLFEAIDLSLVRLDEIERTYHQQKEQTTARLAAEVYSVASVVESPGVVAEVLKILYWEKNLPVGLIGRAFDLRKGQVRVAAGELIREFACEDQCGATIVSVFRSRNAFQNRWGDYRCSDCQKKHYAELQQEQEKNRIKWHWDED